MDLRACEGVNGILTRKVMALEAEVEALNVKIRHHIQRDVDLQRHINTQQQVIEKLNTGTEGLFQEKAALQRQIVSLTNRHRLNTLKSALKGGGAQGAKALIEKESFDGFAAVEAMHQCQLEYANAMADRKSVV